LTALRTLVPSKQARAALIVSDPILRAALPSLTRYEFPHLIVLAQEELDDGDDRAAAG